MWCTSCTLHKLYILRCALPDYPNDTFAIQSSQHAALVNLTIPWVYKDFEYRYDTCHMRNVTSLFNETQECDRWVYDVSSGMHSTFTTQINIVCKNRVMRSHMKMAYMAGNLIGSFAFGAASDIFGRKKVLLVSIFVQFLSGLVNAFVTDDIQYAVVRFFNGASSSGVFIGAFVIGMELVGKSKRMWAGMVTEIFFTIGCLIVGVAAFLIRDWVILQIVLASPAVLFVFYIYLMPESARWLISQSRIDDAKVILKKIADSNGTILPENMNLKDETKGLPKAKLWQLCMTKTLAFRTFVVMTNWVVIVCVYYGLSLNSGQLHDNIFIGYSLSSLVEFLAIIICMLLVNRIGRKLLHTSSMLVGGGALICTIFSVIYGNRDSQWITMCLALIGKLGATAAFDVIYMYTTELYPTVLRNGAMGSCSMAARVGGILAPYIADMSDWITTDFGKALPLVIFGASTVSAGLLALTLPETRNQPLPDTIEEANNVGRALMVNGDVSEITPMTELTQQDTDRI